MQLLADFVKQGPAKDMTTEWFERRIVQLGSCVDWTSRGMFAHVGGKKGASEVYHVLKKALNL